MAAAVVAVVRAAASVIAKHMRVDGGGNATSVHVAVDGVTAAAVIVDDEYDAADDDIDDVVDADVNDDDADGTVAMLAAGGTFPAFATEMGWATTTVVVVALTLTNIPLNSFSVSSATITNSIHMATLI